MLKLKHWIALLVFVLPQISAAQDFPVKPITILCWSEPGSPALAVSSAAGTALLSNRNKTFYLGVASGIHFSRILMLLKRCLTALNIVLRKNMPLSRPAKSN